MSKASKTRQSRPTDEWHEEPADSVMRQRVSAHAVAHNERIRAAIALDPKAHQRWLKAQRSRFTGAS